MADIPHFSLPFRLVFDNMGSLHAAVNEQDSIDDVADCVEAIAICPLGFRPELPDFGLRDQTFSQGGISTEEIQIAISQWEPRADFLIEEDESMLNLFISRARVQVNKVRDIPLDPNSEQEDF